MNLCVFCGSAVPFDKMYRDAAFELGLLLGKRGHTLVFGGYASGLMADVAAGARAGGAYIIGVIPARVGELPGRVLADCDEVIETRSLSERKAVMEKRSDAFIALPGAYGMLDELYGVLAERKLYGTGKPVALLNTKRFFALLQGFTKLMCAEGFMDTGCAEAFAVFDDASELLDSLERRAQVCCSSLASTSDEET